MGVTYIRLEFEEEPEDDDPRWRPETGPFGPRSLGDPQKSIPIWIWGLLKRRPRTTEELARELRISARCVYLEVSLLRRRGHTIERRARKYHLADGPPLLVQEMRGGWRLAPLSPASWMKVVEVE